ncbi:MULTISPECIES: hypothetical protein [unclassified Streptomyces]|uniref:hypothetical protein n=1 Tax=unclassified Streptomyces TaxID=2593676 RepID=UPI0033C3BFA6
MSLYDLPPLCRAFADSAHDSGCRISPGHCSATGTRRIVAYSLNRPALHAFHTEVTCEAHAQALASHWHRYGVRRPGKRTRNTVIARIYDYQRSHIGTYPTALAPALPDMPHLKYVPAGETRRRPSVEVSPVTVISVCGETGPRSARLDITPSDSSNLGPARREMAVTLAGAYHCQVYAGMSSKGPWSDRLSLQAFGDEDNVKALREALPRVLSAAETEARGALTGYRAWLRRRYDDHLSPGERRSSSHAWRRTFLPSFLYRWRQLIEATTACAHVPYVQAPRVDAEDYCAIQAAQHAAHELWLTLRQLDPHAPAAALLTTPPTANKARYHGRRAPYLRPLTSPAAELGSQLTLWEPPRPAPSPKPPTAKTAPPHPTGRPLLETLAEPLESSGAETGCVVK